MERSSRFLWSMDCGKKDKGLFKTAMQHLVDLLRNSQEVSLITDGERRYSNTLFEICYEVLQQGREEGPSTCFLKG